MSILDTGVNSEDIAVAEALTTIAQVKASLFADTINNKAFRYQASVWLPRSLS